MHLSKPKKHFSNRGGGANMYQFHQMHTQICMTLTRSNLIVRKIRLMVLPQILKKMLIAFKKRMVIIDIPFILICNWIKQAEIVKNCSKH